MWRAACTPFRVLRPQYRQPQTTAASAHRATSGGSPLRHSSRSALYRDWRQLSTASAQRVEIDASCVERLKLLSQAKGHDIALRVTVDGGGCSGLQYVYALERTPATRDVEDQYFCRDGTTVIIDNLSLQYISGSKIAYIEEMISASFRVQDNPNADASCGCGVSFASKT